VAKKDTSIMPTSQSKNMLNKRVDRSTITNFDITIISKIDKKTIEMDNSDIHIT
jgi:hypothetical protein